MSDQDQQDVQAIRAMIIAAHQISRDPATPPEVCGLMAIGAVALGLQAAANTDEVNLRTKALVLSLSVILMSETKKAGWFSHERFVDTVLDWMKTHAPRSH